MTMDLRVNGLKKVAGGAQSFKNISFEERVNLGNFSIVPGISIDISKDKIYSIAPQTTGFFKVGYLLSKVIERFLSVKKGVEDGPLNNNESIDGYELWLNISVINPETADGLVLREKFVDIPLYLPK